MHYKRRKISPPNKIYIRTNLVIAKITLANTRAAICYIYYTCAALKKIAYSLHKIRARWFSSIKVARELLPALQPWCGGVTTSAARTVNTIPLKFPLQHIYIQKHTFYKILLCSGTHTQIPTNPTHIHLLHKMMMTTTTQPHKYTISCAAAPHSRDIERERET